MALRHILRAAALFGALWSSAACAQENAPLRPALYVARDADSTLYLYGTVHVRPAGDDWANSAVRSAIDASDEVWTEIEISPRADAQAQALMARLSAAPPSRPLSSWLEPDERARFAALLGRLGLPANQLEAMQPWAAGIALTLIPIMQAGYDPESGVDRALDAYAEAQGKRMRAFETIEEQLGFLSGLSADLQRQLLLEAIDEAEDGPAMLAQLTRAWEHGDTDRLDDLVVEDTREDYPELYNVLFKRRNSAWIEVLMRELAGSGVDFVAVGAGHLVGEDGLVALLQARGVRVERVR